AGKRGAASETTEGTTGAARPAGRPARQHAGQRQTGRGAARGGNGQGQAGETGRRAGKQGGIQLVAEPKKLLDPARGKQEIRAACSTRSCSKAGWERMRPPGSAARTW